MKQKLQRVMALLLTAGLLVLSGCGAEDQKLKVTDFEGPWVDSDLMDVIKESDNFREQDDFAAAVNKEWKLEQTRIRPSLSDIEDAVMAKKKRVVEDLSIEGVEADKLRIFYSLASDWEARNADGVEPLEKYIKAIDAIPDTKALYEWMRDDKVNPLALGVVCIKDGSIQKSAKYPKKYAVCLDHPGLSLSDSESYLDMGTSDLETYESVKEVVCYLLGRMGYSKKEAEQIFTDNLIIEKEMAKTDITDPDIEEEDITYTRKEVLEDARNYPLDEYLNAWGYTDNDVFITTKALLRKAGKLCTGTNFERMKSYLMVHYLLDTYQYTDRKAYDAIEKMSESRLDIPEEEIRTKEEKEDDLMYDTYLCETPLVGAMAKLYAENCFDENATGELQKLTQDIIDKFRTIFKEEDWLSEQGKKACIEKLDAISIHVVYQDYDSVDYSKMNLVKREDGGNFFEAYMEARRFMENHKAEMSQWPCDRNYWDPLDTQMPTTITNAMYNCQTNGIYIFAGICEAPAYAPDMTYEEKLAGICNIIGHEITHGFDANGSQYNKEGIKKSWLPEEDTTAFNDKVTRVAKYFSSMTPYPGEIMYDGNQVQAEETADMGGMKVTLALAGDVKDFDYDRYFRSYARLWKCHVPLSYEKDMIKTDVHPLDFYRINVGVQQFDEFYQTYDVKEKDGMYLEPARRICVW